ncbi:efflux RND transporter periplasmic adaptor subunit [Mangrovibacterium diazotrophicum]|uniref:Membrane fusion protein (Multidrug efflux system) n=1 Tax=Mangrovibacterium diazotrophicum TaxID=1261403 RepID=A0A419W9J1_9BACT|nr:efflux RND transporter periplasmic adaptor subunit [Mangrovibacterium diazotrophicum]RKD92138.1 membrane fusion protein (multidrug efflux system) [Mangrovibacterium diazotrophicum]
MKKTLALLILTGLFSACSSPKPQQATPSYPVVEVKTENIPIVKEFVGQTYGLFDIAIRARVDGYLENLHFKEGGRVKKGQLLYTIDPAPFDAKVAEAMSKVAEAKTRVVQAKSDYQRYKPLSETNAVSQSDYDAAVANLGAAEAALEASNASLDYAKIQQSYTRIFAPISGIIGRSEARESDYVGMAPNPVVLNTISRIDTILVRFSLSELEYLEFIKYAKSKNAVANPQKRDADIELIFADGSVHPYPGKLDFVDRNIDPTTGTLMLQASFPNPESTVRPGQFAKLRGTVDIENDAILIPQKCVQEIQGQYNVFVVNNENKIEFREVTVAQTIEDMWVISSGLKAGEKIILEGLNSVRTGMTIQPDLTQFKSVRTTKAQ